MKKIDLPMSTPAEILLFKTCVRYVQQMRDVIDYRKTTGKEIGTTSRTLDHLLHPEKYFVLAGISTALASNMNVKVRKEHIVPLVFLTESVFTLIKKDRLDDEIAKLLYKHWKIAYITKDEQRYLDQIPGLKTNMPQGWDIEADDADTYARFKEAGIELVADGFDIDKLPH